jgi:XTP/dITP diphosphohydrolase
VKSLLLGTKNKGKLAELQALLDGLGVALLDPQTLDLQLDVDEVGADYASNASLKAGTFSAASGMWCLADDTGLEVDALDGAPGLRSARLIGPSGTDKQRRQRLLTLLAPHSRPWTARFRSVVALAGPQGEMDLAEGECLGEIIPDERGEMGFGYDPIFLLCGVGRTMAELEMEEKNRISHRANAVQAILPILRKRLGFEA